MVSKSLNVLQFIELLSNCFRKWKYKMQPLRQQYSLSVFKLHIIYLFNQEYKLSGLTQFFFSILAHIDLPLLIWDPPLLIWDLPKIKAESPGPINVKNNFEPLKKKWLIKWDLKNKSVMTFYYICFKFHLRS